MYFSELKAIVKAKYGNQAQDAQILSWTNMVIQDICRQLFEDQVKEYRFYTKPYFTEAYIGDASASSGNRYITFPAAMSSIFNDYKIKFDGRDDIYKLTYSTVTEMLTDVTIVKDITAGTAYKIYQDEYYLPSDLLAIKSVCIYGKFLDYNSNLYSDVTYGDSVTFGEPSEYTLSGYDDMSSQYSTAGYALGTITVSGSTGTIVGGSLSSDDLHKIFKVTGSSNEAYITNIDSSGTVITLDRSGIVANASTYMIEPPPRKKIRFYPNPSFLYSSYSQQIVTVSYYRRFLNLIGDSDLIPFSPLFHPLIIKGVDYHFAENQREATMIQESKKNFAYEMDNVMFLNNKQKISGRKSSRVVSLYDQYTTYPRTFRATGEG